MDSRVVVTPIHRKTDLKKVMSSIEEVGSAAVLHPLKSKEAELVLEKYYFNEMMSSVDYPDSSQIYSLQRDGEIILLISIGKINKTIALNIASAYTSSGMKKNFFVPIDLPFEKCFGNKNAYLISGKELVDISFYEEQPIKDSLLLNGIIYCVTASGELIYSDSRNISFEKLEVSNVNALSSDDKGNLIIGCRDGVYTLKEVNSKDVVKLSPSDGHDIFEAGFTDQTLIVVEDKTVVKSYKYDEDDWSLIAEYSLPDNSKLSIQGNSLFFGGLLMVTSNNNDIIDNISFLSVPDLKILKHSRHAQI